MQILSLELENVKSFGKATVNFAQGVNAIVGHNGAGKSTILEAIGFALFDSIEYVQSAFIRAGTNFARVGVTFLSNADERAYQVVRRIGSSPAYYVHDPELDVRLCNGKPDVERFLHQHLGLESGVSLSALFRDAVGVPQGTLTAAFLLRPQERKGIFEALLRVDEYRKVWERLREPQSLLTERRKDLDRDIRALEEQRARIPVLEAQVAETKRKLAEAEVGLARAEADLAAAKAQREALEAQQAAVLAAERSLAQANQRLQGSQARLLAAEQALDDARAAEAVVAAHQDGHDQYVAAQEQQSGLEAQVRARQQLEAQRADADRDLALARADLARLRQDLEQARAAAMKVTDLQPAVARQAEVEQALNEAQLAQNRRREAERRVQEMQALVERLSSRRATAIAQVAQAEALDTQLRDLEHAIEEAGAQARSRRDEMTGFKTRADLIKEQSATLSDVQTALCPVCEQPLTVEHRQHLLTRNDQEVNAMRAEYRRLQAAVEAAEKANQERQAQVRALQSELRTLARRQELETIEAELASAHKSLGEVSAAAQALGSAGDQVASLTQELSALGNPRKQHDIAAAEAARMVTLTGQIAERELRESVVGKKLDDVLAALAAYATLDVQLDEVAARLNSHREAYQLVLGNRRQAEELPRRQDAARAASDEVTAIRQEAEQLAAAHRVAAEGYDAAAFAEVAGREQTLRQEFGRLTAEVDHLRGDVRRLGDELADLEALAGALAKSRAQAARLEQEEAALGHVRELIRQAGPYIAQTLNRQVSEGARQIFSDLMQDYSRHLSWEEDYGIALEVDGHTRQFAQLSGGEQMSAALSVRLALLREMSSIDVAFFDEPTANLDETRREALARQILQVRGFQQIFVISHDDTFEQATQHLIRVRRIDGASQVAYD